MKTQTATIRGFRHGRPIEFPWGVCCSYCTEYAQEDKSFEVPIHLVGDPGETLFFGSPILYSLKITLISHARPITKEDFGKNPEVTLPKIP